MNTIIYDGYIVGISNNFGVKITDSVYQGIMQAVKNRPVAADGYIYRLREDLTWELSELPPVTDISDDDELTEEEAYNIIMGVSE